MDSEGADGIGGNGRADRRVRRRAAEDRGARGICAYRGRAGDPAGAGAGDAGRGIVV